LKIINILSGNAVVLALFAVSQVAFEYVLARIASVDDYEAYVYLRTALILCASLLSFGLNELIVRNVDRDKGKTVALSVASVALIIVGVTFVYILKDSFLVVGDSAVTSFFFLSILLIGFAQVLSSFFRANHSFKIALLLRDGWRLSLWITFVLGVFFSTYSNAVFTSISLFYIFLLVYVWFCVVKKRYAWYAIDSFYISKLECHDFKMGLSFWVSGLSLVSASYFDQLFLGYLSVNAGELKAYSLGVLFIVTPYLLLSSTVGYILMPMISSIGKNGGVVEIILNNKNKYFFMFYLLIVTILGWLYYYALNFLLAYVSVKVSPLLFFLLFLVGNLRLFYSVLSSIMGALGNLKLLNYMATIGIVSVVIQVTVTSVMYKIYGLDGVAFGTLLMWVLRNASGVVISLKSLKTQGQVV